MIEYPLTFRASLWVLGIVASGLAISLAGAWYFTNQSDHTLESFAFIGLTGMFAIGLVEGMFARVVLGTESLEIVSNFRRRAISRTEIVRVVGEKGVPVAVEIRSGGWIKLPSLGAGPHANTVRAWLRSADARAQNEQETAS